MRCRLFSVFYTASLTFLSGMVDIFQPLFEVTADPTSHPELHILLQRVVGFDSVDDESKAERRIYRKFPVPKDWNTTQNRRSLSPRLDPSMLIADALEQPTAPYAYWLYFLYANMTSLNNWRHERGFSRFHSLHTRSSSSLLADEATPSDTFWLRPHAGEAGDTDHLTSAFLTSHSISHGILLRKVPALQYLFYLKQIGVRSLLVQGQRPLSYTCADSHPAQIAMSPLSNNALFLTYERNPFPNFFRTGLNVSLSTDDPLQFHFTKVGLSFSTTVCGGGFCRLTFSRMIAQEPLLEEYSVAAQIYKLSPAGACRQTRSDLLSMRTYKLTRTRLPRHVRARS